MAYKNAPYNLLVSVHCVLLTVVFVFLSRQHFSQQGCFISLASDQKFDLYVDLLYSLLILHHIVLVLENSIIFCLL